MAFIVTSEVQVSDAASASFEMGIPAGHQADDILLAIITQDGGGTAISVSGWNQIGTQAAVQAQRTTAFWKLATSSAEADFSATGTNDDWVVSIHVIRGADTVTPINAEDRTNSINSTTNHLNSGTVTTTENNCLIIHAWGFDSTSKLIIADPNELVFLTKEISLGCVQVVGYRNQLTAGTTTALRCNSEVSSEGGSALTIAIQDADPGAPQRAPDCREAYTIVARHGLFGSQHDGIVWEAMNAFTPATIDGTTMASTAPTVTSVAVTTSPWGTMTNLALGFNAGGGAGQWAGGSYAVSSLDMSGGIFSLEISRTPTGTSYTGPKGVIAVFEDGGGNWVAFTLSVRNSMVSALNYVTFVDLEGATPLDSSGTMDWTDIVRIGYAYQRVGTATTSASLRVKNALLLQRTTLVDGCAASPVTPAFIVPILNGWGPELVAGLQGRGQALGKSSVRYGDGTRTTYVDASATSFEFPLRPNASMPRRLWQVNDDAAEVRIRATANDVVYLTACVLATDTRQDFVLDAASSPSATYDFAGASFVGWRVYNDVAGIVFNGATFQSCYAIDLNGGGMEDCAIVESLAASAVVTNDPENISNSRFISAGSGHAIEITATGSFVLTEIEYENYGADETTDAAIYNNAGGSVTLTIAGGTTPTVRNGVGASTTLVINPVTVTLTVQDASTGNPIENARAFLYAANGTGPLPFNDSISITRSGSTATVSHVAHGLTSGKKVWIRGAAQQEYNGVHTITVTGVDAYTFTVSGTPATPATGSVTATGVVFEGLTDVNGEISDTRSYSGAQPVTGRVRKSTSSPLYRTSNISGTVSASAGLSLNAQMISDE